MGMQIGYGGDARNRAAGGNEDGVSALAYGILEHARESMLVDLRFLEPAFSQIEAQEHPGSLFAVDGATLFFDAGSASAPSPKSRSVSCATTCTWFFTAFFAIRFRVRRFRPFIGIWRATWRSKDA